MVIQMLVGDPVIIVHMEPFDPAAIFGKEFLHIQMIDVGVADIDQRARIGDGLKNMEIFLVGKEMYLFFPAAQILNGKADAGLICQVCQVTHDSVCIGLFCGNLRRIELELRIMEHDMAHMILRCQGDDTAIAVHQPLVFR